MAFFSKKEYLELLENKTVTKNILDKLNLLLNYVKNISNSVYIKLKYNKPCHNHPTIKKKITKFIDKCFNIIKCEDLLNKCLLELLTVEIINNHNFWLIIGCAIFNYYGNNGLNIFCDITTKLSTKYTINECKNTYKIFKNNNDKLYFTSIAEILKNENEKRYSYYQDLKDLLFLNKRSKEITMYIINISKGKYFTDINIENGYEIAYKYENGQIIKLESINQFIDELSINYIYKLNTMLNSITEIKKIIKNDKMLDHLIVLNDKINILIQYASDDWRKHFVGSSLYRLDFINKLYANSEQLKMCNIISTCNQEINEQIINNLNIHNILINNITIQNEINIIMDIAKNNNNKRILMLSSDKHLIKLAKNKIIENNLCNIDPHGYISFLNEYYNNKYNYKYEHYFRYDNCEQIIKILNADIKHNKIISYDIIILDYGRQFSFLHYDIIYKIFKNNNLLAKLCIINNVTCNHASLNFLNTVSEMEKCELKNALKFVKYAAYIFNFNNKNFISYDFEKKETNILPVIHNNKFILKCNEFIIMSNKKYFIVNNDNIVKYTMSDKLHNIDLSRYQIFNNNNNNLIEHSLLYSFKMCNINEENIEHIKHICDNHVITKKIIEFIAHKFNYNITIYNFNNNGTEEIFNKKSNTKIKINFLFGHYFLNEIYFNLTSYSIKNYKNIKNIKNWNIINKIGENNKPIYLKQNSGTLSFDIIKELITNYTNYCNNTEFCLLNNNNLIQNDNEYNYFLIILDIETTSLCGKIIEIAYNLYDNNLNLLESHDILINDGSNDVDFFRMITLEEIKANGISPKKASLIVSNILKQCKYICGHNINFDIKHLLNYFYNYGIAYNIPNIIDTMKQSINFVGLKNRKNTLKYPKLSELYNFCYGEEPDTHKVHRGNYDVEITEKCLKKLVEKNIIQLN